MNLLKKKIINDVQLVIYKSHNILLNFVSGEYVPLLSIAQIMRLEEYKESILNSICFSNIYSESALLLKTSRELVYCHHHSKRTTEMILNALNRNAYEFKPSLASVFKCSRKTPGSRNFKRYGIHLVNFTA
jgi:hypothetical protein